MRYLLRRLAITPLLLVFVTFLTYGGLRLVGTARKITLTILGLNYTDEAAAKIIKAFSLNDNVFVGYAKWLSKAARLDFGDSYISKLPVTTTIRQTLPVSLQLMVMSILFALLLSMPLAIFSAYRVGSRTDRLISAGAFGALSLPGFMVGILLLFFVALGTKIGGVTVIPANKLPTGNSVGLTENFFKSIQHMVLPSLTLAIGLLANYLRILRTDMVNTLQEDYITLAKSKGLDDRYILLRHALRPSSFTLLTVAGITVGTLIGNSLIVEQLFNLNGLGKAIVVALFQRDLPMVLGGVTVITVIFIIAATAVDMLYGVLDPRVRHARAIA